MLSLKYKIIFQQSLTGIHTYSNSHDFLQGCARYCDCWLVIPYNISVNAWFLKFLLEAWGIGTHLWQVWRSYFIWEMSSNLSAGCIPATLCLVYIYLQPALSINSSVKFTLSLKVIGVAGMHLTLLSITLSSWSKP